MLTRFPFLFVTLFVSAVSFAQEIPLLIDLRMEPVEGADKKVADSGPLKIDGTLTTGVAFVAEGQCGSALHFTGEGESRAQFEPKLLNRIGGPLSVAFWVRREGGAKEGTVAVLVTKRTGWWTSTPFSVQLHADGTVEASGFNGRDWLQLRSKPIKDRTWQHVAWTCQADGEMALYIDGAAVARKPFVGELAANDQPLVLGNEKGGSFPGGARSPFKGALDELRLFAAALTPEQVRAEMRGELGATRAATKDDFAKPSHPVGLRLTRWDAPLGFKGRNEMTRQVVKREAGPDAVDWPNFTLAGRPLWQEDGDEIRALPLRSGNPETHWATRQDFDYAIEPGGHWLRATQGLWGHRSIYTNDPTARGAGKDYELWTFPVRIEGPGDAGVRDVVLRAGGERIYENAGPLRSLTLLVPQNAPGAPYELSVAGRAPVKFAAGLQPIMPGDPREAVIPIDLSLGDVTVRNGPAPFPHAEAWEADMAALAAARTEFTARTADPEAAPLLAAWTMDVAEKDKVVDTGEWKFVGTLTDGAVLNEGGHNGHALALDGKRSRLVIKAAKAIGDAEELAFATWIKAERLPQGDRSFIVTSRPAWWEGSYPFNLAIGHDGALELSGSGYSLRTKPGTIKAGAWQHVAFTLAPGGEAVVYGNGQALARKPGLPALKRNDHPLVVGYEEGGNFPGGKYESFAGLIDDARFFAAALTESQVVADMKGTLKTRAATKHKSPLPLPFALRREPKRMRDFLGIEVPRSPLAIHTVSMTHGMSGGHIWGSAHGPGAFDGGGGFAGSFEDYAKYLAEIGYDRVFEQLDAKGTPAPRDARSYEAWLAALLAHGIQGGLNYTALRDSNLAFYTHNLPDWRAPLYRAAQLTTQRFARFPNFAGATMGADNAGYSVFWDWAPVTAERPWGEAFEIFQRGQPGPEPLRIPLSPAAKRDWHIMEKSPTTQRAFVDYIARYDATFAQSYGYCARAVAEIDETLAFTTNSFGSSPGGGGRSGWSGTIPGEAMFVGLPVLQSYDWDETDAAKPLHNFALIDRLRSYFPDKPAWALVDHFMLKYGREGRQRACALLLTRGLDSIGPNWLAHGSGKWARPQIAADEKELYAWIHTYGGAYAMSRPQAAIGVLYVHEQSLSRKDAGEKEEEKGVEGAHEGKTTEALILCHAAGWPAKIVTPAELNRGLPEEMQALLLVGLNKIDDTWVWYETLGPALEAFLKRGGRVLLDHESVAPGAATKTGMRVRAYVPQGHGGTKGESMDRTPDILARNAANIVKLREAMREVPAPLCASGDPRAWAVPTLAGDVQYVTVVNHASTPGKSMTKHFTPCTATLAWTTKRPIYDVRLRRKLTSDEARTCDLTRDAFRYYALPPREIAAPQVTVAPGRAAFLVAQIDTGGIRGVPIELKVTRGDETVTLYTATGLETKLPICRGAAGDSRIEATELLSGLRGTIHIADASAGQQTPHDASRGTRVVQAKHIAAFLARKDVPLTLALTPEQAADPGIAALAEKLTAHFAKHGRAVVSRRIVPSDVVRGLQPEAMPQRFPQWQTIASDLILLGEPTTNLLLLDQARGQLFPPDARVAVTFSPFVGERHAINFIASDVAGLQAAVAEFCAP